MNITFEEAKTIRSGIEKLKETCLNANKQVDLDAYKALQILDKAEAKQREKNARTIKYIQDKRKADKSYARPKNKPIVVTRKTPCDDDCIKCETMRICPIAWKKAEKGEL